MKKNISASLVFFLFVAGACSRYTARPSEDPTSVGLYSADGNLSVSLDYLIVTNGPGSWVRNAQWDEYVLTVSNLTTEPVSVNAFTLIDPRGLYIDSGTDPASLERKSSDLASQYQEFGISYAAGQAAAAAGLSGVFGPLSSLFGITRAHYEQSEQQDIQNEFNRRRISAFRLAGNGSIQGSAFFPVIPAPRTLIVSYTKGSEVRTIELSLERLKGLHITEPSQ